MCKLIAELTGTDKQVLREMIHRLETASGAPGVDVRLTGEIYGKLHMKISELGLDPSDTTPKELHSALINLALLHDKFLANTMGIGDRANPGEVLPAVIKFIINADFPKHTWALKSSTMKKLLKKLPPKDLMKLLNYRSYDSLLKREPISIVMTIAMFTESPVWRQRFVKAYQNLGASDFEIKDIEISYMSEKKWAAVGRACVDVKKTAVFHSAETGVIAILPMPARVLPGLTLTASLLVLHYLNDIRACGTYFKFHHLRGDFGRFLARTISEESHDHARIGGQPVHWKIVHRYFGSGDRLNHPEIFEPHVQPEDLYYRKAESFLYKLEPALHFWHDLDYVGLPLPEGPLSFNLMDVILNALNHVPFEQRAAYHLTEAVWNELYCRYMGQRSLEVGLLQQLDDQITVNTFIQEAEFAW